MDGKHIILSVLLLCSWVACSPRAVHEAQEVVAQADSMWYAGEMYRDSAQLAQAYTTLGSIPLPFREGLGVGSAYLHACYHYGRLLREKDDPVSAMQAFINATHSRSRDYHFLGRVYNNIGDICHLAGEFELSYDMFEQSANMYLKNGDTLLYYYCLNDMAFELAEQGKKEDTFVLLSQIAELCTEGDVLIKTMETKANAYLYAHQYDSAIYFTYPLLSNNYIEPTWILILAQAYSFMGNNDSAVYYANRVLALSDDLYNTNNALYILTNHDKTKDAEDILDMAADRADVQKIIENKRSKYAQASQLITLDRDRKTNLTWLYSIIATLLIVGTCIWIYVYRKRNRLKLISQHINVLEHIETETIAQMRNKLESNCALLKTSQHISKDLCWKDYEQTCRIIDQQFYLLASKLRSKKGLNETETRLCILALIGFNEKDISCILPYASNSVGKLKYRTSQKLGTTSKNLRKYLIGIAIDEPVE